jgi:hypothetical protein
VAGYAIVATLSFAAGFLLFSYRDSRNSSVTASEIDQKVDLAVQKRLGKLHNAFGRLDQTSSITTGGTNPVPASGAASSYSPNYAPHLPYDPKLCKTPRLFGREHAGGWYVCAVDELADSGDKTRIRGSGSNTGAGVSSSGDSSSTCVVYSYGLGADWYD